MLAGVAAGTAAHLRLDPFAVRVAYVVLAFLGVGVVAYALLWLTMPAGDPWADVEHGSEAEGVVGERPSKRQLLGLALLALVSVGVVSRLASFGGTDVVLPLILAGAGMA